MLHFENVRLLGYTHTPIFTGAGLRYRINKTLVFQGTLIDRNNPEGVGSLLRKEHEILSEAIDYEDIIISGINFGKGRVISVTFEGGNLARKEDYTYTIECYEEGDLSNAETGVYTGIDWSTLSTEKIETFSEELTSSRAENGDLQFNHSVAVQYTEYTTEAAGIALAKAFAAALFNAYSGIGAYVQNLQNYKYAKKLHTESYSLVDCSCDFTETIVIPNSPANAYSYSLSYTVSIEEEGHVTVNEVLSITGLTSPRYAGAEEGYAALKDASYTRCAAIAAAYNFSTVPLGEGAIETSRSVNKFTGTIDVTTSYSNNPQYQEDVLWEYASELSRDETGTYTLGEQGTITGLGKLGSEKYQRALDFFNSTVKANIDTRLQNLYNTTGRALELTLINQTLEKDEYRGTIEYSFTKTDNKLNADNTYKRVSVQVQTSNPVHITPKFQVFNYKEIIQPQNQSTLGKVSVNIELKGSRSTPLATFITDAKALAVAYKPTGDSYLEDCRYSFVPQTGSFNMEVIFAFTGAKAAEDVTVT